MENGSYKGSNVEQSSWSRGDDAGRIPQAKPLDGPSSSYLARRPPFRLLTAFVYSYGCPREEQAHGVGYGGGHRCGSDAAQHSGIGRIRQGPQASLLEETLTPLKV